jgi:hypothetical protein
MKKEPEDRNKLKIASFRTTDGDWFDFSQVAESNGLTATDVLKACMVEYQAGTYTPVINTPVSMRIKAAQGLTAEEVQNLINTAISTALVNNDLTRWDELRAEVKHLRERLDNAAGKEYVALIDKGLSDRLNDLWADVESLKKAVKVSIAAINPPSGLSREVMTLVRRMQAEQGLKPIAEKGLSEGLKGKALCEWLFEQGYGSNNNTTPFDSSVGSRFQAAIEHLNSLDNGG